MKIMLLILIVIANVGCFPSGYMRGYKQGTSDTLDDIEKMIDEIDGKGNDNENPGL